MTLRSMAIRAGPPLRHPGVARHPGEVHRRHADELPRPVERAAAPPPRVWSHCRFRNRGTDSLSESGAKRTSGSTHRKFDRALPPPRAEAGEHLRQAVAEGPDERPEEAHHRADRAWSHGGFAFFTRRIVLALEDVSLKWSILEVLGKFSLTCGRF